MYESSRIFYSDSDSSIFATTALALSAGAAVADVAVSGNGRMGIVNTGDAVGADVQFSSRLRIVFTASGTTDGGLEFGGTIRADNAAGGAQGTEGNVFISGGFGKLTMGDIDSALEKAAGDVAGVGYTLTLQESGYIAGDEDEGVMYEYSINGLGLILSAGQPQANSDLNNSSIGLTYSFGGVKIGAGYADNGAEGQLGLSVAGTVAGLGLKAVYLQNEDNNPVQADAAVSATYAFTPALSGTVFYRELNGLAAANDRSHAGVGVAYDLGGGASLRAGYVAIDANGRDNDAADLGLTFNF